MALHFQRLTVTDIRNDTDEFVSISFSIPDGLKKDSHY